MCIRDRVFTGNYVNIKDVFDVAECHFEQKDGIAASVTIEQNGERRVIETSGNGRLDAVSNAIKMYFGKMCIRDRCYRVVNREGRVSEAFAFGGENRQIGLLEADGIEVKDGCVDLSKYQWRKEIF